VRLLALAVVAAALAGCTLGVATCQTDHDCAGGALCDSTAGVCMSVPAVSPDDAGRIFGFDAGGSGGGSGGGSAGGTGGVGGAGGGHAVSPDAGSGPPTVAALLVPTLPSRPPSGGAIYEDVPNAWRRSESVFVTLQSSRPLTKAGLSIGAVPAVSAPATSCTLPCTGHCQCFRVDLWLPPLDALRGTFTLAATGTDPAGANVTASAPLNVTRFNWKRALGQQVRATPAIGADGTLYVGTSAGPALRTGALIAIAPSGLERWTRPVGRVEASPALSAPGPSQRIYVGAVETLGGRLYAFSPAGVQQAVCLLSPVASLEASPTVLANGGAAFYSNGARALISMVPGASPTCVSRSTVFEIPFPGNLVSDGNATYFADSQPRLRRFALEHDDDKREWKERTNGQWPGTLPATWGNKSLALWSSSKLIGAGTGGLFQATVGNSLHFDFGLPAPATSTAHQSPVVAAGGVARAGVPTGIAAVTSTGSLIGAGDPLRSAPALGQGGRLYALAENGALSEWSSASPPARSWTAALDPGPAPAFEASPTLDCARDAAGVALPGRPGVLYAASRSGTLYAVIVDARGIDASAGWPKYQKDPRNSGNASTSLTEFSCP
jgi:hypothetical protein